MRYILSKEELDALVSKSELTIVVEELVALRKIIISDSDCRKQYYCDDCPVSKVTRGTTMFNTITPCPRSREYGK